MLTQVTIIEKEGKKLVKKSYGNLAGIIKWIVAEFPFIQKYFPFETDPLKRMNREYFFFTNPPPVFKTPVVFEYNPQELYIIREYIEGREPTIDVNIGKELGYRLAKLHEKSYCLGDTKLSNFIFSENDIYLTDAEQAINECRSESFMMWDVFFHLYTTNLTANLKAISVRQLDIDAYMNSFFDSYFNVTTFKFRESSFKSLLWFFSFIHPVFGVKVNRFLSKYLE